MESNKIKKRRIVFKLEAPEAKEVILRGDFNHWNPKTHVMKKDDNGVWSKTVMLPSGRHEYKFLVDGEWWNDPNNNQTIQNSFGTLNNVLTVS